MINQPRIVDFEIKDLLLSGHGIVEIVEELKACRVSAESVWDARRILIAAGHRALLASPYGMVQERVAKGPLHAWRVAVVAALMNRTHARQVRRVIGPLFEKYSDPVAMMSSGEELVEMMRPLGFYNMRSQRIQNMSASASVGRSYADWTSIGQFGKDCVQAFCEDRTDVGFRPNDGFLLSYVEWRRECKAGNFT